MLDCSENLKSIGSNHRAWPMIRSVIDFLTNDVWSFCEKTSGRVSIRRRIHDCCKSLWWLFSEIVTRYRHVRPTLPDENFCLCENYPTAQTSWPWIFYYLLRNKGHKEPKEGYGKNKNRTKTFSDIQNGYKSEY